MSRRSKKRQPVPAQSAAPTRWAASLAIVGIAALLIRLACLGELRDSPFFSILIGDALQYDAWAKRILAGDWLGAEVFYQSPLYPYALAVFYSIAGTDPFAVRVAQALLGAASCVLLAIAGSYFFDRRTGLIAAGMLAVYPPAIFFDGLVQKSSLDLFLMTAFLAALGRWLGGARYWWLAVAGIAMGALALNRENAQVLYPVVAGWLLLGDSAVAWRQRVVSAGLLTLGVAAVLLPVAIRNAAVGGEWVISTSQSGPNFYIGNHRAATGGYEPLVPGRGNAQYEREDATRLAEQASGRKLRPSEVSAYWWRRAWDDIRGDPAAWCRILARKARLTVAATEPVDTESLEAFSDFSRLLRWLRWFDFGLVIAAALSGVWFTRQRWRQLSVLYAVFLALAASVVMFYVFARYRFPLVPLAMLFAAAGIDGFVRRRGAPIRTLIPVAAAATIAALALEIPVRTSSDETYFNYGVQLLKEGRAAESVPVLRQAVRLAPSHLETRLNLGLALLQTERFDEAVGAYRDATQVAPDSPVAHAGLAISLHRAGQPQNALAAYERAIRLKPDSPETLSNYALALYQLGRTNDSIVHFERAVKSRAADVVLRLNLCRALSEVQRGKDAIACFQQAAAQATRPDELLQANYGLAQLLAAEGRIGEALTALERALAAARSAGDTSAIETIESAAISLRGAR